jgi:hypothetical protein
MPGTLLIYSSAYSTLAAADTAAVAIGGTLVIDASWTLSANTTLAAPAIDGAGGIITRGAFNLTIDGAIVATTQFLIPGEAGALAFGDCSEIWVQWFCPPPGNNAVDYAPAWQQCVDIALAPPPGSLSNQPVGPRTIRGEGNGWYMASEVRLPDGARYGTIEFGTSRFVTTVSDCALFVFQTIAIAECVDIRFTGFFLHEYASDQGAADTKSITVAHYSSGANDGCYNCKFDQIECANGFAGVAIYPGSMGFAGFWSTRFDKLYDISLYDSVVNLSGAAEKLSFGDIIIINRRSAARAIVIQNAGSVEIEQISYDASGNDPSSPGLSGGLLLMEGVTTFRIGQLHIESNIFDNPALDFSGILLFAQSTGVIESMHLYKNTVGASRFFSIIRATNSSIINITGVVVTLATTAVVNAMWMFMQATGDDSNIVLTRPPLLDAGFSGVYVPWDASLLQQINFTLNTAIAGVPPTAGTYAQGAIVLDSNPVSGGFIGWVCVTAGTPGTWKTFGPIS